MRRLIAPALPALLLLPASVQAAERTWAIGSVERLRVEAPVEVRVVTGGGNGVTARGDDAKALATLDVTASGGTLVVRRPGGRLAAPDTTHMVVTVRTPRIEGAALYAAATVTIDGMKGDRVTLSVTGGGALAVERIAATDLVATLAGDGAMTLAGRSADTRLIANGSGTIDAAALVADRLDVQALDTVRVTAAARDSARVNAIGDAAVVVSGRPACTVRTTGPAQVSCGAPSPPRR
ncbi:GIN domain-containing protein [Sphingomonas adhaesiva]|uniref:GIN domain-containing protein n=1 Tax=Sphingomonas adhaesiva TaxID=28212 RepID=UPI002FF65856